jgi:1-acyl-sn-glycerol-3-phosphate acyltransferase
VRGMAYWVVKALLTPILRYLYDVRAEGVENVPTSGGAILASNHLAVCDSFFLPLVLKRRMTFVAKAEYFEDPKTAWFFRAVGQIPIRREGGSASEGALLAARDVLENGGLFGIYPEGTRSPDGRLYKGHTGIARLALQCRVPVIPVAMIGTAEAQPIGQKPRPFMPIGVKISRPMHFDRFYGRDDDRTVLRQITDEIMYELRELSGQAYVNAYAKRKGAEADEAGAAPTAKVTAIAPAPALAGAS